jgi:hypothetical protein
MPSASDRVMFLNKVILGKEHKVGAFAEVSSCPAGYDSVSSFPYAREVLAEWSFGFVGGV